MVTLVIAVCPLSAKSALMAFGSTYLKESVKCISVTPFFNNYGQYRWFRHRYLVFRGLSNYRESHNDNLHVMLEVERTSTTTEKKTDQGGTKAHTSKKKESPHYWKERARKGQKRPQQGRTEITHQGKKGRGKDRGAPLHGRTEGTCNGKER